MEDDKKKAAQKKTGLATFGSASSSSSSSDKSNTYYAGGHASGVAVQGRPSSSDRDGDRDRDGDAVERLTRAAQQSGAVVSEHALTAAAAAPKFGGTGTALNGATAQGPQLQQKQPKEVVRVLAMYADGFTVDDGPFRPFADPANKEFLDEIGQGIIPSELEQQAHGGQLHVDLVDKRNQKYEPPKVEKPKVVPFVGSGNSLSGNSHNNSNVTAAAAVAGDMAPVDASKPTTRIQIRNKEGGRIVGTFNTDMHTVADVFRFLKASGMHGVALAYNGKMFGPDQFSMTIADAGLAGASVLLQ